MTPTALPAGDGGAPLGPRPRLADATDARSGRTAYDEVAPSPLGRVRDRTAYDEVAPSPLGRVRDRVATVRAGGPAVVATPRSVDAPPATDTEARLDG